MRFGDVRARAAIGASAWVFLVLIAVIPAVTYADQLDLERARREALASKVDALSWNLAQHYDPEAGWIDADAVVQQWAIGQRWSVALEDPYGTTLYSFSAFDGAAPVTRLGYVLDTRGSVVGRVIVGTESVPNGNWLRLWSVLVPSALLASALAGSVAFLLAGRAMRPLTELTRVTRNISRGNFSERAPVTGNRESEELAQGINDIAARLEEVDSQRRAIMAEVVHELRRPLTNVQGYTGIMQDQVLNFAQHLQETVSAIYRQVHLLSSQMDGLRLFAAADSGELELNRQAEPVPDLMAFVTEGYESRALERGVILTIEAPASLPQVFADRDRIAQVVGNLLDNALAHMPNGGEITVYATRKHNDVVISVRDTGEGIDPNVLPHIFDRFYSGNGAGLGHFGLGLTIAKNIVDLHGGQIWATTQVGEGSTFSFSLPISRRNRGAAPTDSRQPADADASEPGEDPATSRSGSGESIADRTARPAW